VSAAYREALRAWAHFPTIEVVELLLGTMRADAHRLPAQTVFDIVNTLILTPPAANSAIYCLVASRSIHDWQGANLTSKLIRRFVDSIDGRVLVLALRALVGNGVEHVDLSGLVMAVVDSGRRTDLERADPDLAAVLFAGM
jgi:hypothetical protein